MRNTLTILRWRIDLYESALYIQKQPDPQCKECRGSGSVANANGPVDLNVEPCGCWDPFHSTRIPLRRRTVITERYPF